VFDIKVDISLKAYPILFMPSYSILFLENLIERTTPRAYISKVLGKGHSLLSIIASATFLLIFFFYIFTVGSYLHLRIYPFNDRVTSIRSYFESYVINQYLDHLIIISATVLWLTISIRDKNLRFIALASYAGLIPILTAITTALNPDMIIGITALSAAPVIISLLLYQQFFRSKRKILNVQGNVLKNYLALLVISTGLLGIIISSAPLFSIPENSLSINNYMYDVFLFFSFFSPLLMGLLIMCFPVKLIMDFISKRILKITNTIDRSLSGSASILIKPSAQFTWIVLFMILSITLALIPHNPAINKDNQKISFDTIYYAKWVKSLAEAKDAQQFLQQAFVDQPPSLRGDRPLTLIFLFTITKIANNGADIFFTIEHIAVVLGPALVVVVFFLTRELTSKNDTVSLLASFITAVSFHMLVGIYTGYYANWLALVVGYASCIFLFRSLKEQTKRNLVIYSVLLITLLFTHTYTWMLLTLVVGIFLAVMLRLKYYRRNVIIILFLVIMSSVIVDLIRIAILGSSTGIEQDIQKIQGKARLSEFMRAWENLSRGIYVYAGGQLSNFIIYALVLYWLFRSNLRDPSAVFLMIFLSVGIIPFFLGDHSFQNRVFYNIPFQIPAAISLATIIKNKEYDRNTIILFSICVWIVALSFRSVSNFYLPRP
jgi:hypothetical protein